MISRRGIMRGVMVSAIAGVAHADDIAFAVGQVWSLSGTDYPDARVIIDRLEVWNGQPIIHISVTGLPQRGGFSGTMMHLPFAEAAVRASVAKLVARSDAPFSGFEAGYDQWKAANGGVFTVSIQQAVAGLLSQLPVTAPPPLSGS